MPKKNKPVVEIVPASEAALVPKLSAANLRAMFERMVREKVDEIMAASGPAQLIPDLQPREVSYELQRRQAIFERRKWALYFEKWGCRMCGKKKVSHASSGHCTNCRGLIVSRLRQIKLEYERENLDLEIEEQIERLTSRVRSAQELLGE